MAQAPRVSGRRVVGSLLHCAFSSGGLAYFLGSTMHSTLVCSALGWVVTQCAASRADELALGAVMSRSRWTP